jgi:hypothetical protein
MPELSFFLLFTRKLGGIGVRYMVSGSVASAVWGAYRSTADVDIVVYLPASQIENLTKAFPADEFYCPPAEVIQVETRRDQRGHFNIIHLNSGYKADIYPSGRDPLNTWGFSRCKTVTLEGEPMVVAPPEYVIVRKLEFYREGGSEKHINDVRAMLELTPSLVASPELNEFIAERGLQSCWNKVLESIP